MNCLLILINTILLILIITFFIISRKAIEVYVNKNSLNSIILFIVLSLLIVILAINNIIFSIWTLINFIRKNSKKSVFLMQQNSMEEELKIKDMANDFHIINNELPQLNLDSQQKVSNQEINNKENIKNENDFKVLAPVNYQKPQTIVDKRPMRRNADKPTEWTLKSNNSNSLLKTNEINEQKLLQPEVILEKEQKNDIDEYVNRDKFKLKKLDNEKLLKKSSKTESNIKSPELENTIQKNEIINKSQSKQTIISPYKNNKQTSKGNYEVKTQFVKNVYPLKSAIPKIGDKEKLQNPNSIEVKETKIPVLTARVSRPLVESIEEKIEPKKQTTSSKTWTNEQINRAWERGLIVPTYEPDAYRSDYAGALMFKGSFNANPDPEHENNLRSYSWTIVHQRPLTKGGTNDESNLWPLNCMNALIKADNYPKWKTQITFDGQENIIKIKKWKGKRKLDKVKD